jgi:drug/metabolite transporter (DMT)-like permease
MTALLVARTRSAGKPRLRIRPREWALLFLLALAGQTLFNQLLMGALRRADPATVGSILGCAPLALAVAGPMLAGRRPGRRTVGASALVVAGAVLVEGFGSATPAGLALALGVLGCELAFSLLAVPLLPRLGALRVAAYSTLFAVPQSLAAGYLRDGTGMLRTPTAGEAAGLVYLGLIATVAAFLLWYGALARLGADRAGLFCGLVPVASALSAVVLGTGTVHAPQMAGSVLVGIGVAAGMAVSPRSDTAEARSAPAPAAVPTGDRGQERHDRLSPETAPVAP